MDSKIVYAAFRNYPRSIHFSPFLPQPPLETPRLASEPGSASVLFSPLLVPSRQFSTQQPVIFLELCAGSSLSPSRGLCT